MWDLRGICKADRRSPDLNLANLEQDLTVLNTKRFHLFMTVVCLAFAGGAALGGMLTKTTGLGIGGALLGLATVAVLLSPLPIYCHIKRRTDKREAYLVILWSLVLAFTLRFPVLIAGRSHMPLRDSLLATIDSHLGISVPAIMHWTSIHGWTPVMNKCYLVLTPLLLVAIALLALAGKCKEAQEFALSNAIAFAIAVPVFALFPAIGPWTVYHFHPSVSQQQCESILIALRSSGVFAASPGQAAPIVCFPSFHVVWAVLSARCLCGFRSLRVPAITLSVAIVISTMATGWHYFVDVLGGLMLALICILLARILLREDHRLSHSKNPSVVQHCCRTLA